MNKEIVKELETAAYYYSFKDKLKKQGNSLLVFGIIYILLGFHLSNANEITLFLLGVFLAVSSFWLKKKPQLIWFLALGVIIATFGISNIIISLINIGSSLGTGWDYFFTFLGVFQILIGWSYVNQYRKLTKTKIDPESKEGLEKLQKLLEEIKKTNFANNKRRIDYALNGVGNSSSKCLLLEDFMLIKDNRGNIIIAEKENTEILEGSKKPFENKFNASIKFQGQHFSGWLKTKHLERYKEWKKDSKTVEIGTKEIVEANEVNQDAPQIKRNVSGFTGRLILILTVFVILLSLTFAFPWVARFVFLTPATLGMIFASLYLKKNPSPNRFTRFIVWSNLYFWLIPPVGGFVAATSLCCHLIYHGKSKKYLILGLIGLAISWFTEMMLVAAITGS